MKILGHEEQIALEKVQLLASVSNCERPVASKSKIMESIYEIMGREEKECTVCKESEGDSWKEEEDEEG